MLVFLLITLVPAALLFAVTPIVMFGVMLDSTGNWKARGRPSAGRDAVYVTNVRKERARPWTRMRTT